MESKDPISGESTIYGILFMGKISYKKRWKMCTKCEKESIIIVKI